MKGVVPPLCGSRLRDRTVGAEIPETRPGRREGVTVDRVLGQILRQALWDRLGMLDELANNADGRSLRSAARGGLRRVALGWPALLATHAPDSPLRVVSTEGNRNTPVRNTQPRTNDEQPERPGQQRRSLARRVGRHYRHLRTWRRPQLVIALLAGSSALGLPCPPRCLELFVWPETSADQVRSGHIARTPSQ